MNSHLLPQPYKKLLKKPHFSQLCRYVATLLNRFSFRNTYRAKTLHQLPPIKIICVSDTHNATPEVPRGDILIHAGDLTQYGTFDELQAQLRWLNALPHPHKIVIAGNHDLLLDEDLIENSPWRAPGSENGKGKYDLDWGGAVYLQDSFVTLTFPNHGNCKVKIFGSPKTPECGTWAFQYPAIRDVWTNCIPDDTDIVVVHGPPAMHGDVDKKGDGYLLRELRRVKPDIVVCGHIHDGHGIHFIRHNAFEVLAEEVELGWRGIAAVVKMLFLLIWLWMTKVLSTKTCRFTSVINAALAPSATNKTVKDPIDVYF